MALTSSEQVLIDAIAALPPNNVYIDARKKEIVAGFNLFTGRSVRDIGWEADGLLVLELSGTPDTAISPPATVRVSKEGDHLRFRCSHPGHNGSERCSHVVCALATLIHLFRPNVFKMSKDDDLYRGRLQAGLLRQSAQPAPSAVAPPVPFAAPALDGPPSKGGGRFEIIVEGSARGLKAFVERGGRRIENLPSYRSLPREIAYLARSGYRHDMSLSLSVFLKRSENIYPVYYRDGSWKSPVEWLGEVRSETWTELDARGDEIVVRKACSLEKDRTVQATIIGSFIFNRERTQMGRVSGAEGWQLFDLVMGACQRNRLMAARLRETDGRLLFIPMDVFKTLQLFVRSSRVKLFAQSLVCKVEGRKMAVRPTRASGYRLVISADRGGRFRISPQCCSAAYSFQPSDAINLLARSLELARVPLAIRTKKRKPVIYDALFRALALDERDAVDEFLKGAIDEEVFGRRQSASEARNLIKRCISAFMSEDTQLHFTGLDWQAISVDKEKEKQLFAIPYEIFGPSLYSRAAHHGTAMSVAEDELLIRLHQLRGRAEKAGIELSLDGRPVELVSWEFAVDATAGSIDWFEIRPEIRCKGETVPRELWEQALSRKGVMAHGGSIQVLDEASLRSLALVAGLWTGSTRKSAAARQVTSIPRLRIIDLLALRKKGIPVRLNAEDEAIMARLARFTQLEARVVPALRQELRQYQREGYYWLAFLYEHGFGACLADDMGLGKTVQAVCLLAALKEGKVSRDVSDAGAPRSLVVVPPTLIFNWEREIDRFYPGIKVRVFKGRGRSPGTEDYDVLIASYGRVRRDIARLKQLRFDVIIFDEAQAIKNIFADTTHAVRQLKGAFKVALTGTPVENHLGEYFSIMDLVLPGLLGDYREFQKAAKADGASVLSMLKERTRPFVLRRTKERILKELPSKIERDVYLELTEEQKRFYNRTVAEVRSTVDEAYRQKAAEQARIIALTAIMKLRQICLTPQLLVPNLSAPAPKIDFLKGKLSELCSASHSSLVFSQFTSFLDLVETELRLIGLPLFRLDGSTPVAKRKGIVDGFQKSRGAAVFLLSLKAGGQGLNLTRGAYVFHLDPWWNPAVESQASDRSHRIGQKKKVIVTRLLMRHTIEEKMTALKMRKASLYRALLDGPHKSTDRAITREDFEFLLGTP